MSHDDRDVATGGAGGSDRDGFSTLRTTEYDRGCRDTVEAIAAFLTRLANEHAAEGTRLHSRQAHNLAHAEQMKARGIAIARDVVRSGRF